MKNVKYGKCVRCGKTYEATPDLTNCSCGGILDGTAYAEDVTLRFHMPFDRLPDFERQLTEKSAGRLAAVREDEAFYPFDLP